MAEYLTKGAITMLSRGQFYGTDVKPVLQVMHIMPGGGYYNYPYNVWLSDGSFVQPGMLHAQLNQFVTSNRLQKGSIVQLIVFFIMNAINGRKLILVSNLHVILEKCDPIGHPVDYLREASSKGPSSARSSAPVQPSVNQLGPKSLLPVSAPEPNIKESMGPETNRRSSKGLSATVGEGIVKREVTGMPSYFQWSNIDSTIAERSILGLTSIFDLSHEDLADHCNYYRTLAQDHAVQLSEGFRSTYIALEAEQARVEALKNDLLEVEGRRKEAEIRLAAERAARQQGIAELQVKLAKAIGEVGDSV